MNESLAKHLHDMIMSHKLNIIDDFNRGLNILSKELDDLEKNVNELIENGKIDFSSNAKHEGKCYD